MNKITIALLLIVCSVGYSQKSANSPKQITVSEKVVGKNLLENSTISAVEYMFSERIDRAFLDKETGFLTVELRDLTKNGKYIKQTGHNVHYDLTNRNIIWAKKVTAQSGKLEHYGSNMIESFGNKNFYIDNQTGKTRWEAKNDIFFVNKNDKIGLGYKASSGFSATNRLEGIDLANGQIMWQRKLDRDYGWNDMFYANDSTLIAVNSGLHAINLNTGIGWDYEAVTGKKDYTNTIATNAVGIGLGILTGNVMISTGHDVVRGLVSNAIFDSTDVFLASRDEIVRLEKESGKIVWKTALPNDMSSRSFIFEEGNVIYMINHGFAFIGSRKINFGKPFVAAYNRDSGKQLFLSFIDATDQPVVDFLMQNGSIILVFKNKIRKYSMESGLIVAEKDFANAKFGDLENFIGDHVMIKSEEDFTSLIKTDSTKMFIYTSLDKVLALDSNLNLERTYDFEELSMHQVQTKELKFISKDQKMQVINNAGKQIAEIDAVSNAFIINNNLYYTLDNSFIKIDLDQIKLN